MLREVPVGIILIAEKHRRIKRELRLIVRALRSIKRRALADFLEGVGYSPTHVTRELAVAASRPTTFGTSG